MRRRFGGPFVCLAALVASVGCTAGVRRLDEHVFHEGPGYRLKVVRYYENIPLHFTGEIYSVQCQSPGTRDFAAHPTQDAGWRQLERGAAIGTQDAAELVSRLAGRYRPIDDTRLVWTRRIFQVSFDACAHVASWDPSSLPPEAIDSVEKPDFCAPKGNADCRAMDFEGAREPRYEEIEVERDGRIGFVVRTPALRANTGLRVTSDDSGRSWRVEPLEVPPGSAKEASLDPAS